MSVVVPAIEGFVLLGIGSRLWFGLALWLGLGLGSSVRVRVWARFWVRASLR